MCFSFKCNPLGRTIKTAVFSFSAYFLLRNGSSSVMVLFTASFRFCCPSIMLSQVGEVLSSKSAIKVLAPEFNALITIFLSTGPVISTRLSVKSFGTGAACQLLSLMLLVSKGKVGNTPLSNWICCALRASKSSNRLALKFSCKAVKKSMASSVKMFSCCAISSFKNCHFFSVVSVSVFIC